MRRLGLLLSLLALLGLLAALGPTDWQALLEPLLGVQLGWLGLALVARRLRSRRATVVAWGAALAYLRRPRLLLGASLLTAASLGLGCLVNVLALQALGLPASLLASGLMLLVGYAVGLLPSTPGQAGLFELAVAAPLIAIGFSPPTAVAAALALHAVLLAALLLGGLAALLLYAACAGQARA
jgi:uncharacterized membrane protein YbhN (UPF0104 family)